MTVEEAYRVLEKADLIEVAELASELENWEQRLAVMVLDKAGLVEMRNVRKEFYVPRQSITAF